MGFQAEDLNKHLCSLDWVEIECVSFFPHHPVPSFRGLRQLPLRTPFGGMFTWRMPGALPLY